MLDGNVVIDKLKAEGISDTLGANLTFETADELDAWVTSYKSSIPKEKKLQDYTLDELEEIAKDPQFKGAKGLQGFLDKERQKAREKSKTSTSSSQDDDKYKELLSAFDELKTSISKRDEENTQSSVMKMVKAKFSDADEVDAVMSKIGKDYSDENVEKQINWYFNKFNKTSPPLHPNGSVGAVQSAVKKWQESNK